jgi:hypothetical protein
MLVAIFGQRVAAVLCASGFHLIGTGRLFGVGFGGWPVAASGRAGLSRDAHPIEINGFHFCEHFVLARKPVTRVANRAETWNYVVH